MNQTGVGAENLSYFEKQRILTRIKAAEKKIAKLIGSTSVVDPTLDTRIIAIETLNEQQQTRLTDIDEAITAIDTRLDNIDILLDLTHQTDLDQNLAIGALTDELSQLTLVVTQNHTDMLAADILLANGIAALYTITDTHEAQITQLNTDIIAAGNNDGLEARVTAAEATIVTTTNTLNYVSESSGAFINATSGRLSQFDTKIAVINQAIGASNTDISDLKGRVTQNSASIALQGLNIAALDITSIAHGVTLLAHTASIATLFLGETNVSFYIDQIHTTEAEVAGQIASITTRVATLEAGITATNNSGNTLVTRVVDLEDRTTGLEQSGSTILSSLNTHSTSLDALQNASTVTNTRIDTLLANDGSAAGLTAALATNTAAIADMLAKLTASTAAQLAIDTAQNAVADALAVRIGVVEGSSGSTGVTTTAMKAYVDPAILKVAKGICAGQQYLGPVFAIKTQINNTDINIWTNWNTSTNEIEFPIIVTQVYNLTNDAYFTSSALFIDSVHNGPNGDAPQISLSVTRYIDQLLANKPVFLAGLDMNATDLRAAVKWYIEGSYEFVVRNNDSQTSDDNYSSISAKSSLQNGFVNGMTKAQIAAGNYRISRMEQYTVFKSTTATNSVYFITDPQFIDHCTHLTFSNKNGIGNGVGFSAFAQSGFNLKITVFVDTTYLGV